MSLPPDLCKGILKMGTNWQVFLEKKHHFVTV